MGRGAHKLILRPLDDPPGVRLARMSTIYQMDGSGTFAEAFVPQAELDALFVGDIAERLAELAYRLGQELGVWSYETRLPTPEWLEGVPGCEWLLGEKHGPLAVALARLAIVGGEDDRADLDVTGPEEGMHGRGFKMWHTKRGKQMGPDWWGPTAVRVSGGAKRLPSGE